MPDDGGFLPTVRKTLRTLRGFADELKSVPAIATQFAGYVEQIGNLITADAIAGRDSDIGGLPTEALPYGCSSDQAKNGRAIAFFDHVQGGLGESGA